MAKKDKTAPDIVPEGDAPKKSKKKLIVIVVVVLLLGGVGYKFTLGKGAAAAKPALVAGKVVPLESINLNLAGGHYLKLGLALQATTLATESPDGSQALDLAIALLSNRSLTEIATPAQRATYKKQLVAKVKKAYADDVMDVYFTEFVTQ